MKSHHDGQQDRGDRRNQREPEVLPPDYFVVAAKDLARFHSSNFSGSITSTVARIWLWPMPHSSEQAISKVPVRSGRNRYGISIPGTTSCLKRSSRTKKS